MSQNKMAPNAERKLIKYSCCLQANKHKRSSWSCRLWFAVARLACQTYLVRGQLLLRMRAVRTASQMLSDVMIVAARRAKAGLHLKV